MSVSSGCLSLFVVGENHSTGYIVAQDTSGDKRIFTVLEETISRRYLSQLDSHPRRSGLVSCKLTTTPRRSSPLNCRLTPENQMVQLRLVADILQ